MIDPAVHIARLQAHADDQARIIREKNGVIKAIRAENSTLWCARNASQTRAMKAEHERDGIAAMRAQQVKTIAELQREVGQRDPSEITDEMVDRFCQKFYRETEFWLARATVRQSLVAALTPPPARPGWEYARAVLAHLPGDPPGVCNRVWENVGDGRWRSGDLGAKSEDLVNVKPLYPREESR